MTLESFSLSFRICYRRFIKPRREISCLESCPRNGMGNTVNILQDLGGRLRGWNARTRRRRRQMQNRFMRRYRAQTRRRSRDVASLEIPPKIPPSILRMASLENFHASAAFPKGSHAHSTTSLQGVKSDFNFHNFSTSGIYPNLNNPRSIQGTKSQSHIPEASLMSSRPSSFDSMARFRNLPSSVPTSEITSGERSSLAQSAEKSSSKSTVGSFKTAVDDSMDVDVVNRERAVQLIRDNLMRDQSGFTHRQFLIQGN